jgi:hypothetical protein
MPASSRAGITLRTLASTSSVSRAVCSIRVPVGAQMQADLAGVDRREEVLAGEREQARGRHARQHERGREAAPVRDRRGEQRAIAEPDRVEAAFERGLQAGDTREHAARRAALALRAHQHHRERRHQRAREEVRRDHREDHRLGHRHEQVARDARQQEHRHEHDADRQRRHEGRHRDLAGAVRIASSSGSPRSR